MLFLCQEGSLEWGDAGSNDNYQRADMYLFSFDDDRRSSFVGLFSNSYFYICLGFHKYQYFRNSFKKYGNFLHIYLQKYMYFKKFQRCDK